jgi:hypothetical protein
MTDFFLGTRKAGRSLIQQGRKPATAGRWGAVCWG